MARESILIVDDEPDILKLVEYNLAREGFRTDCVESGEEAIVRAKSAIPELIILDLMLPGLDGLEVCRVLKTNSATCAIPIIMLTAKGEEPDIVTGLQLGADDYMVKPFSPRVLVARVKAVLRRAKSEAPGETEVIKLHEITIDPGRHMVTIDGQPIDLTLTEFRIIHSLARRPGWVFTRAQILDLSWGEDSEVTDRSVDVHIVSLRRKLGDVGKYVETVRGVGYRFAE